MVVARLAIRSAKFVLLLVLVLVFVSASVGLVMPLGLIAICALLILVAVPVAVMVFVVDAAGHKQKCCCQGEYGNASEHGRLLVAGMVYPDMH